MLNDFPTRKMINFATHPNINEIINDLPKEYHDSLIKVPIDAPYPISSISSKKSKIIMFL